MGYNKQRKIRSLVKIFLRDSKIIIFVYDITKLYTFKELKYWFKTTKEVLGDSPILGIVGNKADLYVKEEVNEEQAREFAKENNAIFKLISAKSYSNINFLLEDLLKEYIKKKDEEEKKKNSLSLFKYNWKMGKYKSY